MPKSPASFPEKYRLFIRWYLAMLVILPFGLQGQQFHFEITQLGPEQGLPGDEVQAIAQDKWGYLWFGAVEGLIRYDGRSFRHFSYAPEDSTGLAGKIVTALHIEPSGDVWAIGHQHISRLDRKTNLFVNRHHSGEGPKTGAWGIAQLDTTGRFLVKVNDNWEILEKGTNELYPLQVVVDREIIPSGQIMTITRDSSGFLWLGTDDWLARGRFLDSGRIQAEKIPIIRAKNDFPLGTRLFLFTPSGQVWLSTWAGVYFWDGKGRPEFIMAPIYQKELANGEIDTRTLNQDYQGRIWVGLHNKIWIFHPDRPDMVDTLFLPALPNVNITSVFHDASGKTHWVGTNWGGVFRVRERRSQFEHLARFNLYNPSHSLAHPMVYNSLQDRKGNWWFATFDGLSQMDGKSRQFRNYKHRIEQPGSLPDNRLCKVYEDRKGNIWVGTRHSGPGRLLPEDGLFASYRKGSSPCAFPNDNYVRSILEDPVGQLWLSHTDGISMYQPGKDCFFNIHIEGVTICAMDADPDGSIWAAGTNQSLYLIDAKQKKLVAEYPGPDFLKTHVYALCSDANSDDLWLGTMENGVVRFDKRKRQFVESISTEDGLAGNVIASLLMDRRDRLWVGTESGLSCFDPASRSFTNFNLADDLPFEVFIAGSAYAAEDGSFVFGGYGGALRFFPDRIEKDSTLPRAPVHLTSLRSMGLHQVFDLPVEELDRWRVRTSENNLEFEFNAFDYGISGPLQYRYKMGGFDADWQQAGQRGYASYANLPAGKYLLEIQCLDREGRILGATRPFEISVIPFFYETLAFQIAAGIILLIAAFAFAAYRERRRLSRSLLENKEKALKKQLSQHFIFNTLNLANADILRGDMETANHNLVQFSQLLRFYFKELQQTLVPLEAEIEFSKQFLELANLRYSDRWTYEVEVDPSLSPENWLVPPLFIQPYLENAVKYAFPKSKKNGLIQVRFSQKGKYLSCKVLDNGKGLLESSAFEEAEGLHAGFALIQERIHTFNQLFRTRGWIRVTDRSLSGLQQTGVEVDMEIPLFEHSKNPAHASDRHH